MTNVEFHPEARAELLGAVRYYEDQATGLGMQFTDKIERAIDLIGNQPEIGAPIDTASNLRC